ncbi:MAG: ABC transporter ATP-binding protein [Myxococcota bacterium]
MNQPVAAGASNEPPAPNGAPGASTASGVGQAMVEVQGLTKFYRDVPAIQDLNFTVRKGEVVGFLGPNGAGKSTTMRILTGCIPATSGVARIAGLDVFESPMETKRKVGYLPELPPVYMDLTVAEQLRFGGSLKGLGGPFLEDEIQRVSKRAGVHDVLGRIVGNLSKGYRQRVGLAQALLGDPDVLILDEPTVGLDPRQINEVRALVRELGGHHTVILSTHILQEVTMTCQRAIIIAGGRVVADDTLEGLTQKHQGKSLEEIFLHLTAG